MYKPLADIIRPATLNDVVGQSHLLGQNGILAKLALSNHIPNMIFYGPSGTGKTTVANILADKTNRKLHKINATNSGIGEIKALFEGIDTFLAPQGILLYIDEIHYFNKKQQQSLLEYMENGKITLIASTTENPYFYLFNAILSRSTVFEFKPLSFQDISLAINRTIKLASQHFETEINVENGVVDYISKACGGDVRKAINAVEILCKTAPIGKQIDFTLSNAKQIAQKSSMRYDKDGDEHYDILSAFQKSIRGSDANAGLHYLARLLSAGDLLSACRRLLVTASEDIGLAYPNAVTIVKSCVDSALQLGLPEAQIPLAQAVILLATSPKSNSAVIGIGKAMHDISTGNFSDIPAHLKDSHYKGSENLNHGIDYIYPHDKPNSYVKQQYLPDVLTDVSYYNYGNNKFEQQSKQYWDNVINQTNSK